MEKNLENLVNRNTPSPPAKEYQANKHEISNLMLIRSIASQCRQWCEDRDQLERNPTGNLGGWCAVASGHLWRELRRKGINSEIHLANVGSRYSHCYVMLEDYVVDITASQFREFRDLSVVFLHEREAQIYEFYRTTEVFESAGMLRKFQKKHRWPEHQICYEEYL